MNQVHTIKTVVHGIQVHVHSTDASFVQFIEWNLPTISDDSGSDPIAQLTCELVAFETLADSRVQIGSDHQQGTGLKVETGVEIWDSGLHYESLRIEIDVDWRLPRDLKVRGKFKERIDHSVRRWILRQDAIRYQNYQVAARQLVYSPLFWLLEKYQDMFLLHAAGVSQGEHCCVFAGLNGIGKTTLALRMLNHGYGFLGDNYLLHDGEDVYSFHESVRIDPRLTSELGLTPATDIRLHGKHVLSAKEFECVSRAKPDKFLVVTRGEKTSLKEISPLVALQMVLTQSDFLAEYPEHTYMGLADHYHGHWAHKTTRWEEKILRTRRLLSSCKVGLLVLAEGEVSDTAIPLIERF